MVTYEMCVWLLGATTKQRPQRLTSLGTRHPTKHEQTCARLRGSIKLQHADLISEIEWKEPRDHLLYLASKIKAMLRPSTS